MKLGSHVNFWGTIGTASVLLWSLSQSRAKPEYSPTYAQIEALPKPSRRTTAHLAPTFQDVRIKATRLSINDVSIKKLRKLRKYAAVEAKVPVYQLSAGKNANAPDGPVEIKGASLHLTGEVTVKNLCKLRTYADAEPKEPVYQSTSKGVGQASGSPAEAKLRPRLLVKDVTIRNLCKLRTYAAVESKDPVYRLASKETGRQAGSELDRPVEIKVTPVIRDAMNRVRPKQITGTMKVEGKKYEFGSGGHGQSIPYGDYRITPGAIGSWGSRHGAIGVADGTIPDPKLHRDRDGIELHAATNDKLQTNGCVSIRKDQWPEFRKQVFSMLKENKKVYLHVSDQGASISTNPLEFVGETISEPKVLQVLSMIEAPTRKAAE